MYKCTSCTFIRYKNKDIDLYKCVENRFCPKTFKQVNDIPHE